MATHEVAVLNDKGEVVRLGFSDGRKKGDDYVFVDGVQYLFTQVVLRSSARAYSQLLYKQYMEMQNLKEMHIKMRAQAYTTMGVPTKTRGRWVEEEEEETKE